MIAKVPTIDPGNASITTESPRAKLDMTAATTGSRMFFNLGKGLEDISAQLEKVQTLAETTKDKNAFALQAAQLKNDAKLSTDTSEEGLKKYHTALDSLASNSGSSISIPYAKNIFQQEIKAQAELDKFEISGFYRTRKIDEAKVQTEQNIDLNKQVYINSTNPSVKKQALADMTGMVQMQVDSGLLTREDGYKRIEKIKKDIVVEDVAQQLNVSNTPEQASAVKDAILSGAFEQNGQSIDPEVKKTLISNAESKISGLETQAKKKDEMYTKALEHDDTVRALTGQLPAAVLEEHWRTKRISDAKYKELEPSTLGDVGPTSDTIPATYNFIIDDIANGRVSPEKASSMIVKSNQRGQLSQDDALKIYQMHLIPTDSGFQSLSEKIGPAQTGNDFAKMKKVFDDNTQAIKDQNEWWKPAINSIASYFTGPTRATDIASATRKLYDSVAKNKIKPEGIPAEADKILAQQNIKAKPEVFARASEKGSDGFDRFGPVTVYKDGRVARKK